MATVECDRLLRIKKLTDIVGLGQTRIHELVKARRFPQPIRIDGATLWSANEVNAWIAARLLERQAS